MYVRRSKRSDLVSTLSDRLCFPTNPCKNWSQIDNINDIIMLLFFLSRKWGRCHLVFFQEAKDSTTIGTVSWPTPSEFDYIRPIQCRSLAGKDGCSLYSSTQSASVEFLQNPTLSTDCLRGDIFFVLWFTLLCKCKYSVHRLLAILLKWKKMKYVFITIYLCLVALIFCSRWN